MTLSLPVLTSVLAVAVALPTAEQIDRLLYSGTRAPSPHNAQGYLLAWDGARITVRLDPSRQVLHGLDPTAREGELACGAVVANLEAAAAGLGLAAVVRWRPEPGMIASVSVRTGIAAMPALLTTVSRRSMNRAPYSSEPVKPEDLLALHHELRGTGFTLRVLTDRSAVSRLATLAARAGALKLAHADTAEELHRLMRFTGTDAAAHRDGLDLRLFDLPLAGALACALVFHPAVQRLRGVPGLLARVGEQTPLREAPAVCLLCADRDGPDAFLHGGRAFQRVALRIAELGLSLQPHSAPIEVALSADSGLPRVEVEQIDAGLRSAFGCPAGARPIVLFRLGKALREPQRKSLRRIPTETAPRSSGHYEELTSRNQPALPEADQRALSRVRVLFAGCGSIGGAPIEPLARMGLTHFLLAEPGAYELNNLNRQAALLPDVGRNKAEVLRDLVARINPAARVLAESQGVTAENVDWLVGSSDLIVDGVDVTEESGLAAKRLLHEEAFRQQRVVLCGLDLAGTQLFRIFDYRDPRARPFDGRLDRAPAHLSPLEFLARIIDPLDFPIEMLDYVEGLALRHNWLRPPICSACSPRGRCSTSPAVVALSPACASTSRGC
jgi:molybdopterin/thiamine biosynthesis adenylyltransferase/nitroreductase